MAARRADLLASGRRARARVIRVDHAVDVDDVVVLSQIHLQVDGTDDVSSVRQAVPPTLVGRVVAGAVVDVLVRDDELMIEWSY